MKSGGSRGIIPKFEDSLLKTAFETAIVDLSIEDIEPFLSNLYKLTS